MHILFRALLTVSCLLLASCIPPRSVTLVGEAGEQFIGQLSYDDPFSGTLTIESGPGGEQFSGRFVVVDRTATQQSQGAFVAPQRTSPPAIGAATNVATEAVDASGFWYAVGNKGSRMDCTLSIGRGGHGHGVCKHANGKSYRILL